MGKEYFSRTPRAGYLATGAASQLITVNQGADDKWQVIYLKNLDDTESIVIAVGTTANVAADNSSPTGQYDDQYVVLPGEEIRVVLQDIRYLGVIRANGAAGTPALRWRMGLD